MLNTEATIERDLEAIAVQLASELATSRERRMGGMFAAVREMQRWLKQAKENDDGN